MTSVRERKILRCGGARVVSLPPDWLRFNGLGIGDTVEVRYNGVVQIRPLKPAAAPAGPGVAP